MAASIRPGAWLIAGLLAAAAPAPAQEIEVPSGQPIELRQTILDTEVAEKPWLRLFFLAPEIGREPGARSFAEVEGDFAYLCEAIGLPLAAAPEMSEPVERVVVAMTDRPMEFGTSDPEATRFFEAFSLHGDACVWEGL